MTIKNTGKLKNGNSSVLVKVLGESKKGNYSFKLESNQKLSLKIKDKKITKKEIISSYSILKRVGKKIFLSL